MKVLSHQVAGNLNETVVAISTAPCTCSGWVNRGSRCNPLGTMAIALSGALLDTALVAEQFHSILKKQSGLMGLFSCMCPEIALFKVTC